MGKSSICEETGLKRGAWTPEEDRLLTAYVARYGHWNWRHLPKYAGLLRCGKSCRLRWLNYLRPNIKRGKFTREEDETIENMHAKLGNKWAKIAASLPGRTDSEIKNHWHTNLKKRYTPYPNSNRREAKGKATIECGTRTKPADSAASSSSGLDAIFASILESSGVTPRSPQWSSDFSSSTVTDDGLFADESFLLSTQPKSPQWSSDFSSTVDEGVLLMENLLKGENGTSAESSFSLDGEFMNDSFLLSVPKSEPHLQYEGNMSTEPSFANDCVPDDKSSILVDSSFFSPITPIGEALELNEDFLNELMATDDTTSGFHDPSGFFSPFFPLGEALNPYGPCNGF